MRLRDWRTGGVVWIAFAALLLLPGLSHAQQKRLDVTIVADEPNAVLAILERRAAGEPITDMNWVGLLTSEGYVRLKQREASLQRAFEDTAFRSFVLSDALLARAPALRETLDKWTAVDPAKAAARALSYLPASAAIRAKIYPSIKPRSNSFVFETSTNPAIFLYLDPNMSDGQFENTLAHELHHIGYASVCKDDRAGALLYMGTFAEGRAVLAAAGSPDAHPHATSPDSVRAVWERDYAKARTDMKRLESFFTAVADQRMSEAEAGKQWLQFVSTDDVPQGAFYTVGYLMSRTIEKQLGRERLIASLCDPLMFITDYNQAAQKADPTLPRWSAAFLRKLRSQAQRTTTISTAKSAAVRQAR